MTTLPKFKRYDQVKYKFSLTTVETKWGCVLSAFQAINGNEWYYVIQGPKIGDATPFIIKHENELETPGTQTGPVQAPLVQSDRRTTE